MEEKLTTHKVNSENLACKRCLRSDKPIICKGVCRSCYAKAYRKTDKGREAVKAYNSSAAAKEARDRYNSSAAAKEARRKYKARKKALKPPKPPKQNCECGKPSVVKNMCKTCYDRSRYIKKERSKGATERVSSKKTINKEELYNKVLSYVKKGFTIIEACKKAGYKSSSNLYRLITPAQKAELNAWKILRDVDDYHEF